MERVHGSLYEELARELESGLGEPAAGIIDHHMHIGSVAATKGYVKAARSYGVERALGLASVGQSRAITAEFGGFFAYCGWCQTRGYTRGSLPVGEMIAEVERMAEAGFVAIKFKIVPDEEGRAPEIWLDDERLEPLFSRAEELGLSMQAHIAQPDAWFDKHYDEQRALRKEHYFRQVEYLLGAHPGLTYVGVHMGGHPENLDYLDELMGRHPHFHVDTSATKWVVRELSRQHGKAREFFIRRADRILFGSDLVVQEGIAESYYTSRFHVQRTMWETAHRGRSMIKDPDSEGAPILWGLELPGDVLRKIYRANALRIVGE